MSHDPSKSIHDYLVLNKYFLLSMLKKNFCDIIAVFSFDQFNVLIIFDSTCNTDKQYTKRTAETVDQMSK